MTWTPFENRPRPVELGGAQMTLQRLMDEGVIVLRFKDYDTAGAIYAWLMGQMTLAKREADPVTFDGPGLLKDDGSINER